MARQLTKYTKPANLEQSVLQDKNTDTQTPYSFVEWQQRHVGIEPSRVFIQYNQYLRDWYNTRNEVATTSNVIREEYVDLLKKLAVVFRDDIQQNIWLTRVNFEDEYDL